jgi:hypothetical protein
MARRHRWIARGVVIGAVLVLGIGTLGWLAAPGRPGPVSKSESASEAGPAPTPSAGFGHWAALTPTDDPTRPGLAGGPAAPVVPEAPLPAQGSAWCQRRTGRLAMGEEHPSLTTDEQEAQLQQARVQARLRWSAHLRAQKDLRSQAFADFLDETFTPHPPPSATTRAHLHDLARISTDPLVTVMALQRPCPGAPCRGIERTQWSRLEPQNALAWIAAWDPASSEVGFLDYALERIRSQANRASGHMPVLTSMLLSLPREPSGGVDHVAEIQLLDEWSHLALTLSDAMEPAVALCLRPSQAPGQVEACQQIAELTWQRGSPLERRVATSLGLHGASAGAQHARWAQRRLELEAVERVFRARQAEFEKRLAQVADQPCRMASRLEIELRQRLREDAWTRARNEVLATGLDLPTWIARWDAKLAATPP